MNEIIIRQVSSHDLDECFRVETSGFPSEEAATREAIKLRIDTFPRGTGISSSRELYLAHNSSGTEANHINVCI